MRVLHISKYDLKGGASRAAYNSVIAQRSFGIDAELLVGQKQSSAPFVHTPHKFDRMLTPIRFLADKVPNLLLGRDEVRSLHYFGQTAKSIELEFRADLVVLHKIDGIVPVNEIVNFGSPVIWRTHDMWPICGSKHYQDNAGVFGEEITQWNDRLLPRRFEKMLYERKRNIFRNATRLTFCPPSQWLAKCFRESPIFDERPPVEIVPNGIDTDKFKPLDRNRAREELHLPIDTKIILFGAVQGMNYKRKGFDLLLKALRILAEKHGQHPMLLVFGDKLSGELSALDMTTRNLGVISDDHYLAKIYSAADVFVAPSRQENLSLSVLESLSCGTPVAAFDVGGMPDMIRDGRNGWLARPFDTNDLADKLQRALLLSDDLIQQIRNAARQTVTENFSLETEAAKMSEVYERVLKMDSASTRQPRSMAKVLKS